MSTAVQQAIVKNILVLVINTTMQTIDLHEHHNCNFAKTLLRGLICMKGLTKTSNFPSTLVPSSQNNAAILDDRTVPVCSEQWRKGAEEVHDGIQRSVLVDEVSYDLVPNINWAYARSRSV